MSILYVIISFVKDGIGSEDESIVFILVFCVDLFYFLFFRKDSGFFFERK